MVYSNLVWYAGFGSNISKDRFHCYIEGGKPEGNFKNHEGCRNKDLPKEEKSLIVNHELYFAKKSRSWKNGGVGFINAERDEAIKTFARMYLITKQQLEDLAKQENNTSNYLSIDFEEAISKGETIFKTGAWYGKLLYLGKEEQYPIFTLTSENYVNGINRPSEEYLQTIINGLKEAHNLTEQEIIDYFIDKQGIQGRYSSQEISRLV